MPISSSVVGKNIERLRGGRGMSRDALVHEFNKSKPTDMPELNAGQLRKLELGGRPIDEAECRVFATVFKVPESEIETSSLGRPLIIGLNPYPDSAMLAVAASISAYAWMNGKGPDLALEAITLLVPWNEVLNSLSAEEERAEGSPDLCLFNKAAFDAWQKEHAELKGRIVEVPNSAIVRYRGYGIFAHSPQGIPIFEQQYYDVAEWLRSSAGKSGNLRIDALVITLSITLARFENAEFMVRTKTDMYWVLKNLVEVALTSLVDEHLALAEQYCKERALPLMGRLRENLESVEAALENLDNYANSVSLESKYWTDVATGSQSCHVFVGSLSARLSLESLGAVPTISHEDLLRVMVLDEQKLRPFINSRNVLLCRSSVYQDITHELDTLRKRWNILLKELDAGAEHKKAAIHKELVEQFIRTSHDGNPKNPIELIKKHDDVKHLFARVRNEELIQFEHWKSASEA